MSNKNDDLAIKSKEEFGELFFDWWWQMWKLDDDINTTEEILIALRKKFPYDVEVPYVDKSNLIHHASKDMTEDWTCYLWENEVHGFFSNEEDKVRFILHVS